MNSYVQYAVGCWWFIKVFFVYIWLKNIIGLINFNVRVFNLEKDGPGGIIFLFHFISGGGTVTNLENVFVKVTFELSSMYKVELYMYGFWSPWVSDRFLRGCTKLLTNVFKQFRRALGFTIGL